LAERTILITMCMDKFLDDLANNTPNSSQFDRQEPTLDYEYSEQRIRDIQQRLSTVVQEFYSAYASDPLTGKVITLRKRIAKAQIK